MNKQLLNRDQNNRLGAKEGSIEIKSHPWFKDLDWQKVY